MPLHPLVGHASQRRRLAGALRAGRLPQVLLLTGPTGVGKQRLGLWIAQLALCDRPGEEPCGACRPCRLVLGLVHPDVHWFVPVARSKAADADKQVDEAAESLAQVMEERRQTPRYAPPDGMACHGMASVRLLLRRAALTPVEGRYKVFLIGDAERLVPQESSPDAANALLKLLEEPPADTLFVLTAADIRRLLPTVRSRAVPLRLGRLTDAEVAEVVGRPAPEAQGAPGVAVAGVALEGAAEAVATLLDAIVADDPGARMERALRQPPFAARGDFTAMLDALADALGDAARQACGESPRRPVPAALRSRCDAGALLRAIQRVADAREAAAGNVNPQLLLATLAEDLAEAL
ncbi:MAG TPA: hypothetical protein VFU46_07300 [Gemmatimonadales bacterium]|nr:hypothetical protein [Gemmatimonadales bacterium]